MTNETLSQQVKLARRCSNRVLQPLSDARGTLAVELSPRLEQAFPLVDFHPFQDAPLAVDINEDAFNDFVS